MCTTRRTAACLNADRLPTPNGEDHSTAQDQVRRAETALRNPTLEAVTFSRRRVVAETADRRSYAWSNTNKLLGAPGALGMKTGYTRAAGYSLAFAADRKGRRLVGVILGETIPSRCFQTAGRLMDWATEAAATGQR
ncbi:hypothetical protein [Streptosporangium sp. NPDC000396]|uniref:hypothetical protein n=1 Tax=Streptosporangium sp. NPDC000396 TaxID=3366185 RepID=UPI003680DE5C